MSENLLDEIYRAKDQLRNAVHTSTGRHVIKLAEKRCTSNGVRPVG